MQINNNCNTPTYKGLSRTLAKDIFSCDTIQKLKKIYPKSKGIVGSLPYQWIENIPIEKREKNIKFIYKYLGKICKNVKSDYLRSKLFTFILRKSKSIQKNESIKFSFIDSGCYGEGYIIENSNPNKKPLFMKIFTNDNSNAKSRLNNRHGTLPEANTKYFIKKQLQHTKDKKYFSNFHYADLNNQYYIEDFIDKDVHTYALERSPYVTPLLSILRKLGLKHTDLHLWNFNIVGNQGKEYPILFDLGGIIKKNSNQ